MSPEDDRAVREEKVHGIAEEALQRLSADLAAGRSESLLHYLAAMGRFHRYSWNNVLLIASQRPTATRVAGFHTWHQIGRWVKRGEKSITIIAPVVSPRARPDRTESPEQDPDRARRISGFRAAHVFDVVQTEGKPLPELSRTTGDPREFTEKLKAFVARQGIALEYDRSIAPAQGMSSGGRIRLLPDLPAAEEFSVLAHETAHELLHHKAERATLDKTLLETQAEAVAFVICRGVGLETHSAAADYIALYNGDAKTLAESLAAVQETASRVLKDLLPADRDGPDRQNGNARSLQDATETSRDTSDGSARDQASSPDSADERTWDR